MAEWKFVVGLQYFKKASQMSDLSVIIKAQASFFLCTTFDMSVPCKFYARTIIGVYSCNATLKNLVLQKLSKVTFENLFISVIVQICLFWHISWYTAAIKTLIFFVKFYLASVLKEKPFGYQ